MEVRCLYDEMVPVAELRPHPKNRNSHSDEQISRLAKILKYQGVRAPVVVSRLSGCIVKGHGTLAAIKLNQAKKAPVVFKNLDSEEQENSFVK